jgi:integrase
LKKRRAPRRSSSPPKKGRRTNHLLRRLKEIAEAAKVTHATMHKFRHTYATRLLESGCDNFVSMG